MTDELIQALQNPALYGHPVRNISVIETHISWVILTGQFAYKIKKPVDFGFVNFSTLEKRRFFCAEELRLNRRFAPNLYLDVIDIKGSRAQPLLAGDGKTIEYAIRMREFSQHDLLSTYAAEHRLEPAHIDAMAAVIADFHSDTPQADPGTMFGSSATFLKWSRENFTHIETTLSGEALPSGYEALKERCLSLSSAQQAVIDKRQADGCVRECHGDLHLGNMALIDGRITLFDCIEFNPELRWIDTMSEVAFVAMDLQARGYAGFSWRFLNHYLQTSGDYAGITLLRRYLVYRALVRAKVEALHAQQKQPTAAGTTIKNDAVSRYLDLAESWSDNNRPAVIIMHGFSGSGKSTVAKQLVEAIGAIQLRSDIERKRLFDLAPTESSGSGLKQGIYNPDATRQTYHRLADLAGEIIQAGYTVIVDASFLKLSQRSQFKQLARQYDVPYTLISCGAPASVLRDRIKYRSAHEADPSEATGDVLLHQIESHDPLTGEEQTLSLAPPPDHPALTPGQLQTLKRRIA